MSNELNINTNRQIITAPRYVKAIITRDSEEMELDEDIFFYAELINAEVDSPYLYKGDYDISFTYSLNPLLAKDTEESFFKELADKNIFEDEESFYECCNDASSADTIEALDSNDYEALQVILKELN